MYRGDFLRLFSMVTRIAQAERHNPTSEHGPGSQPLSEKAMKAKQRPANFSQLSAEEQWSIDKELGILDWDGK